MKNESNNLKSEQHELMVDILREIIEFHNGTTDKDISVDYGKLATLFIENQLPITYGKEDLRKISVVIVDNPSDDSKDPYSLFTSEKTMNDYVFVNYRNTVEGHDILDYPLRLSTAAFTGILDLYVQRNFLSHDQAGDILRKLPNLLRKDELDFIDVHNANAINT